METEVNVLGKKIRNLRENNDLTQKELSAMIGLTPKMVSFYENNQRTPPLDILIKLSKIFNVSIDYLVNNTIHNASTGDLSAKEVTLIYYFRETEKDVTKTDSKWGTIDRYFPNARVLSEEEQELLDYYNELSLKNKRWIMGQMIDLLKKSEETSSEIPKAQ